MNKNDGTQENQLSIFDFSDPVQRPDGAFVFGTDLTMSWDNAFDYDRSVKGVATDSISDALIRSLTTLGRVDVEYMASITGKSFQEVINGLKGSIYCNPAAWGGCYYKGWETTEEYLSGNLLRKLNVAERANRMFPGQFDENIKAIKRALPQIVPTKDIYVTLGSPWVPTDIIDDFITYMLELRTPFHGTLHDELTGTWEIPDKAAYGHRVRAESTYGTPRIPALHILERTLNMRTVAVTDEAISWTNNSGKTRIVNKPETVLALEKQQKMIKDFQRWVWKNEERKERLESIFERNFSCVRRRIFDGSFLSFPNMSPEITLYPYQKDAVARILFTPNTLLAHDVGSGKTYVMIAAGMELKRMGLSEKNMYVVPNNIVGQWESIFHTMYPNAKLLVIEPKSFGPAVRDDMLRRVRDELFDGIIIAYSCFEQIPLSQEYYVDKLTKLREEIASLERQKGKGGASSSAGTQKGKGGAGSSAGKQNGKSAGSSAGTQKGKSAGNATGGSAKSGGGGVMDDHSRWGTYANDEALKDAWVKRFEDACEAMEIRQASTGRGTLPAFAKRILQELRKPQTDWRTILNEFIQEEVVDYSFTPPDRRFEGPFFLPDFNEKDDAVENVLFMIDTSGSMSDAMITAAYSEVKGAIDQFDGKLKGWLGFFDAAIIEPTPFESEEEFEIIKPVGGGGTDFHLIFKYVKDFMQDKLPVSIIILTDGYAPFPEEDAAMGIPVLWLLNNEQVAPPWGKVARITVNEKA